MDSNNESGPATAESAWSILFSPFPLKGRMPFGAIKEPTPLYAYGDQIDVAEALLDERPRPAESLLVIFVGPRAEVAVDIEQRAEAWLAGDPKLSGQIVRATLRTIRVAWSGSRAVVFAPTEHFSEVMDAILRFVPAVRQTAELEEQVASLWPVIDAHKTLLHTPRWRQLEKRHQVKRSTERAANMRASYLRLTSAVLQLNPALGVTSKRLYAELAMQCTLQERLDVMESPIEYATYHYDMINARLIDARNNAFSNVTQVMIVVVLTFEVLLFLSERLQWPPLSFENMWAAPLAKEMPAKIAERLDSPVLTR